MKCKLILIVDDEEGIRKVLHEYLKEIKGYQAIFASDALMALEILSVNKVELLITDIAMPRYDGKEFLENVYEKYPHLPVVIVSDYSDIFEEDPIVKKAKMLISKPISFDHFSGILKTIFNA